MKRPTNYLTLHHCALFSIFIPEIPQSCVDISEEDYVRLPYVYKMVDYTIDFFFTHGFHKIVFDDDFITLESASEFLIEGYEIVLKLTTEDEPND